MNNIIRLTESDLHRIIKESVKAVLKEQSEDSWKWPKYGLSDDEYNDCKENVRKFVVHNLYPELSPRDRLEQFFRDTYRDFCKASSNWTDEKIEEDYSHIINVIDKYGFAQAEWASIPQGWWHFAGWLLKKKFS